MKERVVVGVHLRKLDFSQMNANNDSNLSIFAFSYRFCPWVVVVSVGLSFIAVDVVNVGLSVFKLGIAISETNI